MDTKEHQTANPKHPTSAKKAPHGVGVTILLVVALILIVIGIVGLVKDHNNKNTVKANSVSSITPSQVNITKTGFVPQVITVRVGQAVTWSNGDSAPHEIASDPYPTDDTLAGLNSRQPIMSGQAYAYVFKTAGTYYYHDNLNPYKLKGTVIVK